MAPLTVEFTLASARDDADRDDGPLVRALAAPLRALLGGADVLLGAIVRVFDRRDGETRGATGARPLRAIPGGAIARARRQSEASPIDAPDPRADTSTGDDVDIDIGDHDEGEDVLLVLPRDAQTVFVTWHLSAPTVAARAGRMAGTALVVRDALSVEARDPEDRVTRRVLLLPPLASSAYVDLGQARSTVRIAFGTSSGDDFVTSIPPVDAELPAAAAGPHEAPRWRTIGGASANDLAAPPDVPRATADFLLTRALAADGDAALTPASDAPARD